MPFVDEYYLRHIMYHVYPGSQIGHLNYMWHIRGEMHAKLDLDNFFLEVNDYFLLVVPEHQTTSRNYQQSRTNTR